MIGEVYAYDSFELDVTDYKSLSDCFADIQPELVINASAYTAVDNAESDSERAILVNSAAVAQLALLCQKHQTRLIHVSTDFVFDGKQGVPYRVDSHCHPLGVYGASKREGELAVLAHLPETSTIIRTAWLYSAHGNNFVKTMLRLMKQRSEINVVCDQVGTPTSVDTLADLIKRVADSDTSAGILHWTDAGVASWYDFAVAIYEEASALGILSGGVSIVPVSSAEYPTPAVRPAYSILDKSKSYEKFGMPSVHWRLELRKVLNKIVDLE